MSVQAWFSNGEVSIAPGGTVTLPLTVHNLGDSTESYTIVPAGLAASWTSVGSGNVTLFGGSQEVIDVTIAPPALPATTAGPTAISIRVIPLGDSDDAVVAETTLMVEPFEDCRIVPLQPVQRARHRATYEFMIENHGNTVSSRRLHLIDATGRMDGDFDPPAVGVAPGGSSLVRLKARAQRDTFRSATRTLDFEIEAAQQGHAPVTCAAALVQSPTLPTATLGRIAAVLAVLLGALLAWLAVVKPTIEDAAADEVDRQLSEDTPDDGDEAPGTTIAGQATTAVSGNGTPTYVRLEVAAPLTQTLDQSYSVPSGEVFDLTDVRIENPFNDEGVATLLVNDETMLRWSLENIRGSLFEPRITSIRLQPGDNLTFSVKCDVVGDENQSTCSNAINLGGETYSDPDG